MHYYPNSHLTVGGAPVPPVAPVFAGQYETSYQSPVNAQPNYPPSIVNPTQISPVDGHPQTPNRVHNPYGANIMGSPATSAHSQSPATMSPYVSHQHPQNSGSFSNSFSHMPEAMDQGMGGSQGSGAMGGRGGMNSKYVNPVSTEELMSQQGHLAELARTANGSSFIQAALRDNMELSTNLAIIWAELEPHFADLLLDAHGCYVTKTVMENLHPDQLQQAVSYIAADEQLIFSLCTHSLHTRRVVQFLMDTINCSFIVETLTARCAEVAMTQQGCIIMQRAMDVAAEPYRYNLFSAIYSNILIFAVDPFANYVIQHMFEVGIPAANSQAIFAAFHGHVLELCCNKFSSNVMEKALYHVEPEVQHILLMEMYSIDDEGLLLMLQDSFGNYLIQSSIALAQYKDVFVINEKLRPVLERTPYGYKIAARLDRRLKGKPVGTRSPAAVAGRGRGGGGGGRGRGGNGSASNSAQNTPSLQAQESNASIDSVTEEPW